MALRRLQATDGSELLVADGDEIAINSDALDVDVWTFDAAGAACSPSAMADALALYEGELLEGLHARSDVFEAWLTEERARLRNHACDLMHRLGDHYLETGAAEYAIKVYRRLLALDPFREKSHRALMEAYAKAGRRTTALEHYRACAEMLKRELNVAPDPETTQLFERIRHLPSDQPTPPTEHRHATAVSPEPKPETRRQGDPVPVSGSTRAGRSIPWLADAWRRVLSGATRPPDSGLARSRRIGRWSALAAGALLIVVAGLATWHPWRDQPDRPLSERPSIAVLPLRNLSGNPGDDYLGDAMADGIISGLSTISRIVVLASSSTLAYKGRTVTPQEVARQLGVMYVLEGSFQRRGDRLRVTVLLTQAKGNVLWSETYDPDANDIFTAEDDIIMKVITGLQVELTEGEQERLSLIRGTTNRQAWEYSGQGLHLLRNLNREDNVKARSLYELAVALDPKYAGALDGLAWTHLLDAQFGWSPSPEASVGQAVTLAQQALALDPNRDRTYALLGQLELIQGNFEQAIAYGEKSIALSPNGAENYALLAFTYSYSGEPKQAIYLIEQKAMKLSPLYPGYYLWILGRSYRLAGNHNRALQLFTDHLKVEPGSLVSAVEVVTTYGEAGRIVAARQATKRVLQIEPKFSLNKWARTLIYRDRAVAARELAALRNAGLPD